MEGGGLLATCPRCRAFVSGPPPCPICGYAPGTPALAWPVPASPFPEQPTREIAAKFVRPLDRRWRRTRLGLLLTAIGLLLSWVPFIAALAALFLSFGSTFLFLGARAAGRKHEVRVVLAFLFLAVGGIAIGLLLGAFLLQAYDAARARQAMSTLRDVSGVLVWWTLPATCALSVGFALQVVTLLPRRQVVTLLALSAVLAATASLATWLSGPELDSLGPALVRTGTVADFLFRLSLYRLLEGPAYVGLAILYFLAYWDAGPRTEPAGVGAAAAADPGKA